LRVQLLQKDHVAAGLTCIQLFQNSATADEAVQHLEAARVRPLHLLILSD
jgi:zinc finger FYVE domain-containing protein 26